MRGGGGMREASGTPWGVKPTDNVPRPLSRNEDQGYPCGLCRRKKPVSEAS